MNPYIPLLLAYALIAWLFYRDVKERPQKSLAWLVPAIWVGILGSRPVGYWMGEMGGYMNIGGTTEDGSPINVAVQGALILAALVILAQRGFSWGVFLQNNKAIIAIYTFYALSMVWAPNSFVCLRRVGKDFGCVIVALVLLTDEEPLEAIRVALVRCCYVLFTLSVVFIRYFPSIGRSFAKSGEPTYTGITTQKNTLGEICVVFTLILVWDLWEIYKKPNAAELKTEKRIRYFMILMGLWLVETCQSKTALLCIIAGSTMLLLSRPLLRTRNPKTVLASAVVVLGLLVICDSTLDLSGAILQALGRDKTFTGRSAVWENVLKQGTNPIWGFGFCSFWESDKGQNVFDALTQMVEAHNGYLEVYLDGGIIGLCLLGTMLLTAGGRSIGRMLSSTRFGAMSFAFWVAGMIYNGSESDFFRLGALWFAFILMTITPGSEEFARSLPEPETATVLEEVETATPFPMNAR